MKNIGGLQMACIIIAIISLSLFTYTGRNVVTDVDRNVEKNKEGNMTFWSLCFMFRRLVLDTFPQFLCFEHPPEADMQNFRRRVTMT